MNSDDITCVDITDVSAQRIATNLYIFVIVLVERVYFEIVFEHFQKTRSRILLFVVHSPSTAQLKTYLTLNSVPNRT